MFDSNIKACDLVKSLKAEIDAAPEISYKTYYEWIDEAEQLLYSDIIKEIAVKEKVISGNIIALSEFKEDGDYDTPRFEDIYAVYVNGVQLIAATAVSGETFPDSYWKVKDGIQVNAKGTSVKIYYFVRPKLKATDSEQTIKLPPEWVRLIRAKLRGEAYKLASEGAQAAVWLNDYNAYIEQFKEYIARRATSFGV